LPPHCDKSGRRAPNPGSSLSLWLAAREIFLRISIRGTTQNERGEARCRPLIRGGFAVKRILALIAVLLTALPVSAETVQRMIAVTSAFRPNLVD
jgi:hypothetical protein